MQQLTEVLVAASICSSVAVARLFVLTNWRPWSRVVVEYSSPSYCQCLQLLHALYMLWEQSLLDDRFGIFRSRCERDLINKGVIMHKRRRSWDGGISKAKAGPSYL